MKFKAPASLLFVVTSWLGAQACFTDNEPEYQWITERSTSGDRSLSDEGGPNGEESDGAAGDPSTDDARDPDESSDASVAGATTDDDPASDEDGTDGNAASVDDEVTSGENAAQQTDAEADPPGSGLGDTNMDEDPNSDCASSATVVDPDSEYYPPCCLGPAINGEEIKKGTQCIAEDVQHCYRVCGPFQLGWKTEDCLAGVYAEGDCEFPQDDPNTLQTLLTETGEDDYACFAVPDEIDTSLCPQDAPPKSTAQCDVPECTPCNLRDLYRDTNDNTKEGYCVCRPPDANGIRTWTCASITAWPCPFSKGC